MQGMTNLMEAVLDEGEFGACCEKATAQFQAALTPLARAGVILPIRH